MSLERRVNLIRSHLTELAKKLNVPYYFVLTEFLLERLLVRLLHDPVLSSQLIFKGGYVSLRVYHSPRYTIDIDALLKQGDFSKIKDLAKKAAEKELGDGVWFLFEKGTDLETQGAYGGYRMVFRCGIGAPLKNVKKAQIVNLDIGKGDPIHPKPREIKTPVLIGVGFLSWNVCPIETTVAEKLHALISRGSESSRSKDIFDLSILLPQCNKKLLLESLEKTFKFRANPLPEDFVNSIEEIDIDLLKRGWRSATSGILGEHDFDKTFHNFITQLKKFFRKTRAKK